MAAPEPRHPHEAPGPKGRDYASVWNNALDEGPLKTITRGQRDRLQAALGDSVVVDWAMRYGKPEVSSRIQALLDQGCDRILLVPLYPQYAAATSATACDQAFKALMQMRWQPTVRVSPPYTTTRSTSTRSPARSAKGSPSSISSRR